MKTVYKSLRLGVVSAALALAVTGFALAKDVKPEERCHCVVPAGSTGQILSSSGDVQVSRPEGFSLATPGMALSQGSVIFVGLRSDARIVFGGCHLSILPMRDVSLDAADGSICVRVKSSEDERRAGAAGAKAGAGILPAIVAGVAGVGAFVAIAVSDSDPVSLGAFVAIAVSDSDPVSH